MNLGMISVISISGLAGTGTTTISKMLAEKLGYDHVYAGAIIRKMAEEHDMDIVTFNDYIKNHPEMDREVDELIVEQAKKGSKILEGRLSGAMLAMNDVPALKVLLTVSPDEQARRVSGRDNQSLADAQKAIITREEGNEKRYKELYPNIDYKDLYPDFEGESVFDLRIDTTDKTPEEICDMIVAKAIHR